MVVESMYQDYLQRIDLREAEMTRVQRQEMRNAFFAACASTVEHIQTKVEANELTYGDLKKIHQEVVSHFTKPKLKTVKN